MPPVSPRPATARADPNAIGAHGESLFRAAISRFHGAAPLFNAAFLGEKWQTADYLVELYDKPGYIFFVAVKTTRAGLNQSGTKLKIAIDKLHYQRLSAMWIPSFFVGVDGITNEIYIEASRPRVGGAYGISVNFPLNNDDVCVALYQNILDFWDGTIRFAPRLTTSMVLEPEKQNGV